MSSFKYLLYYIQNPLLILYFQQISDMQISGGKKMVHGSFDFSLQPAHLYNGITKDVDTVVGKVFITVKLYFFIYMFLE